MKMRHQKKGISLAGLSTDSEDTIESQHDSDSEGLSEKSTLRIRFTPEEDERLKELVKDAENNRWEKIAQKMPGRTARQCRDRYNNYLFKEISTEPWNEEEDLLIMKMHKEIGSKWTQIAQHLVGRSGNNVKNRWYKHLKKFGKMKETKKKKEEQTLQFDIDKIWATLESELRYANEFDNIFRFD